MGVSGFWTLGGRLPDITGRSICRGRRVDQPCNPGYSGSIDTSTWVSPLANPNVTEVPTGDHIKDHAR